MRIWIPLLALAALAACAACNATDDPAADGGSAGTAGSTSTGGKGGKGGSAAGTGGSAIDAGQQASTGAGGSVDDPAVDAGIAGSAGSAGSSAVDAGSAECSPCIEQMLTWGANGGLVAFTDSSTFTDCNTYQRTRIAGSAQTTLLCERPVPCMGSGVHGIADVLQAIANSDVRSALVKGMVLFGTDSRPVDGQVLRIELAGSTIEVGGDCPASSSSCTPIPAGVSQLARLLRAIDDEQLHLEPCASAAALPAPPRVEKRAVSE